MKITPFFLILFLGISVFSQNSNRDKEVSETIDWLNQKLTQYQYETSEVKQIFTIVMAEQTIGDYNLTCIQEQWLNGSLLSKEIIKIPILKINSVSFNQKAYNYWLDIKMKNNESAILVIPQSGENYNSTSVSILLSKSIDEEGLRPRIQKAFNYLLGLYGNKLNEKF